jgi:GntR family transcriptional regulator
MGVNTDDPRAPYVQVANELQNDIETGKLAPGKRVPPIRELAERFNVSGMTVQSALRELRHAGLITAHQGRGTFVRSDALEIISREQSKSAGSPDTDSINRHLDALSATVQEMRQRLMDLEAEVYARRDLDETPDSRSDR